jgi:hypothetical protein
MHQMHRSSQANPFLQLSLSADGTLELLIPLVAMALALTQFGRADNVVCFLPHNSPLSLFDKFSLKIIPRVHISDCRMLLVTTVICEILLHFVVD